jgi:hypothetical protein
MTDKEPLTIVELRKPTQCVLWENPGRLGSKFELFEEVESSVIRF